MKNKKIIRKIFIVFSIIVIILSPIKIGSLIFEMAKAMEIPDGMKWTDYDNYTVIDEDTTWSGHVVFNDPRRPVIVVNGATLTIEKGTWVEILILEVNTGRIVAEGAENEKITFTKAVLDSSRYGAQANCIRGERGIIKFAETSWVNEWYNPDPSILRYVEFNGMGSFDYFNTQECNCPPVMGCQAMNHNIFYGILNTAQAAELPNRFNPALKFKSGSLRVENSVFKNNYYADIEVDAARNLLEDRLSSLEIVNSNFEGNNEGTALISHVIDNGEYWIPFDVNSIVKLKNNWYGSRMGPKVGPDYLTGGEKISGEYTLSGWRSKGVVADPVIVIPGIMGSFKIGSQLVLDPVLHTYDNLIASFKENGYVENVNLFEFPYEWRDSNILSADLLKQKIQEVKNSTGASKVDLVAHSMGGLVARYYIEGNDYQNDVDQLITLGTPHRGAPKSYLSWEAGEVGVAFDNKVIKKLFSIEALHAGYTDLKKYIQDRILSVKELLPDYDYLEKGSSGEMKSYHDGYPRNTFLEFLNKEERIEKLDDVDFLNIAGKLDSEKTIKKFRVVDSAVSGKWEHGMPENFYDDTTDRGIEYGKGDGTVPLSSTEGIKSDGKKEVNSLHRELPTKAQCDVIEELTGDDDCEYAGTSKVVHILTFGVFSPVDIEVVAPDGKKVGKDQETGEIVNEIEGAYYSGFETENEFLTIPNPEDGEYEVLIQGTGRGGYKVEASKISESEDTSQAEEVVVTIEGTATNGSSEEKMIKFESSSNEKNSEDLVSNDDSGDSNNSDNHGKSHRKKQHKKKQEIAQASQAKEAAVSDKQQTSDVVIDSSPASEDNLNAAIPEKENPENVIMEEPENEGKFQKFFKSFYPIMIFWGFPTLF